MVFLVAVLLSVVPPTFQSFPLQTFHHHANLKEEQIKRLTSRAGGEIKRNGDSI